MKNCLEGIKKYSPTMNYEIIVVDNASTDGSAEMMRDYVAHNEPHIRFVASSKNVGHPSGNNLGLQIAKGDYVLLLNTDIVIYDNSIDRLYNFMVGHPKVGMAGAKLYNPDYSVQFSCLRFPSVYMPLFRRTFLGKTGFGKKYLAHYLMQDFDHNHSRSVDWVLSSCLMVSRSALKKIGLMDSRYFLYFSDVDWCQSAWKNNYEVWYVTEANFVHYHKRDSYGANIFKELLNITTRMHIIDWFKYLIKTKS